MVKYFNVISLRFCNNGIRKSNVSETVECYHLYVFTDLEDVYYVYTSKDFDIR